MLSFKKVTARRLSAFGRRQEVQTTGTRTDNVENERNCVSPRMRQDEEHPGPAAKFEVEKYASDYEAAHGNKPADEQAELAPPFGECVVVATFRYSHDALLSEDV
jgi:hypothetical protein